MLSRIPQPYTLRIYSGKGALGPPPRRAAEGRKTEAVGASGVDENREEDKSHRGIGCSHRVLSGMSPARRLSRR